MDVRFRGPAGALVGLLEEPEEGAPRGTAVVCHPHPQHGGTMRNTVVFRVARALRAAGLATLRFDFRGVEESEGEHHGGGGADGEEGDVAAALDLLERRYPGLSAWAAGYSFGARTVCALAAREPRIRTVVLVALPIVTYGCAEVDELRVPGLLVFGGNDPFGTETQLRAEHPELPSQLEIREIPGADHFFRGRTPLLEEAIRAWAVHSMETVR